jgi:cytochrome c peroxidase
MLVWPTPAAAELLPFEDHEVRRIVQHGPWPWPAPRDPSNRASGRPAAIVLGQRLFFDARLSVAGTMSCATCHLPDRGWTDGQRRAIGTVLLDRNTPGLWNVGYQRWFGWDGAGDSLWAQSIRPILDARELGATAPHVAALIRSDPSLACHYRLAFETPASAAIDDEALLVDAAKALAAFQESLVSGRTPFDEFRDALGRGDRTAAARYPLPAQRGARIFVGRGNCAACHTGATFTNGEFHDVGVPFFLQPGRVDPGRHGGIKSLRASRFNLLGPYNDAASGAASIKTRHVELQHRNWGEFKVPSLRNVALTGPYMHDGRYATLREVVVHYSELNEERLHADGERILRPLKLGPDEVDDVVAFLESLTDPSAPYTRRPDRAGCP